MKKEERKIIFNHHVPISYPEIVKKKSGKFLRLYEVDG